MPRLARLSVIPALAALALAGTAQAGPGFRASPVAETSCAPGAYSVVTPPDGTSVSILFDDLQLTPAPTTPVGAYRMTCHVQAPLHLPAGYSLGMYRVDYRGYAHLVRGQMATVLIDYNLEQPTRRRFGNTLAGPRDGVFSFTEIVPPGQMKRVGCGDSAVLDLTAILETPIGRYAGGPIVSLDSVDGGPAVTYRFDLRKC